MASTGNGLYFGQVCDWSRRVALASETVVFSLRGAHLQQLHVGQVRGQHGEVALTLIDQAACAIARAGLRGLFRRQLASSAGKSH